MRSLKLALIISALGIFVAACGDTTSTNQTSGTGGQPSPAASPSTPTPTPDEFAAVRATYKQSCARCHQEDGEGGVYELEEGGRLKVPSFKEGHALRHTDAQFIRQVRNGGDGMPAFKDKLSEEQIAELVRFIRREFQGGAAAASPSPPASPHRGHD